LITGDKIVRTQNTLAYCGLICSDCPAYIATQSDKWDALERVAVEWRELLGMPGITADDVACDGCLTRGGHLWINCADCAVRTCAIGRGVDNCGHCPDYACDRLEAVFRHIETVDISAEDAQDPRATLDAVRRSLKDRGRSPAPGRANRHQNNCVKEET
jgi:hypothetical protein